MFSNVKYYFGLSSLSLSLSLPSYLLSYLPSYLDRSLQSSAFLIWILGLCFFFLFVGRPGRGVACIRVQVLSDSGMEEFVEIVCISMYSCVCVCVFATKCRIKWKRTFCWNKTVECCRTCNLRKITLTFYENVRLWEFQRSVEQQGESRPNLLCAFFTLLVVVSGRQLFFRTLNYNFDALGMYVLLASSKQAQYLNVLSWFALIYPFFTKYVKQKMTRKQYF